MIKVNKWYVPDNLFNQYVNLIKATEKSNSHYTYEFDKERREIHNKIILYLKLEIHTKDYIDFSRSLNNMCEDILLPSHPILKTTKINTPIRGMIIW